MVSLEDVSSPEQAARTVTQDRAPATTRGRFRRIGPASYRRLRPIRDQRRAPCGGGEPVALGFTHRRRRWAVREWPQLLGHPAEVSGGVEVAEQREQAEIDALDEHERAGNGGVGGDRAGAVERVPHDRTGVLLRPRHRAVLGDRGVEIAEVAADVVGRHRRVGTQQADALGEASVLGGVVVDGGGLDHGGEEVDLVGGEVAHQPEVEERDPPVAVEEVVPGVRVAVEGPHAVQAAEHEAVQALAVEVALGAGPT